MARSSSPTLRRRELATRLRDLRLQTGLTADEVAARMLVSPAKISRIETGARGVSLRDVRDLCEIYTADAGEREHLATLVREAKQPSWWQQYDLPYATFVGLESAAATILDYESSVIPGLLQTEDYARAVTDGILCDAAPDLTRQRVEVRLTRQRLLTQESPPQLWTVIDEAALHRVVGGPGVMRAQLEALAERATLPNVTVQVVPFEAGAHPGMDSTFILLHLEEEVSDVVYIEGLVGNLYQESPSDLARYRRVFDQLRAIAL
ncbi:MAG TPA: helix-turn-helix transcriptional regulator, partial [Mycobacteriales bacterium]